MFNGTLSIHRYLSVLPFILKTELRTKASKLVQYNFPANFEDERGLLTPQLYRIFDDFASFPLITKFKIQTRRYGSEQFGAVVVELIVNAEE